MNINWDKVELVIFDVDGTLYDQSRLRKKMAKLLLNHYLLRPWSAYDLQVIRVFRKERELMNLQKLENLEEAQYQICANRLGISAKKVKQLIEKWMYKAPLPYLKACCYQDVHSFFQALQQRGIKTAVYSDYPAREKLQAMGLTVDVVVASTDKEIDALKPNPQGLSYIMNILNVSPANCLFIGDRDELDGACARSAGMQYCILTKENKTSDFFYTDLCARLNQYKSILSQ